MKRTLLAICLLCVAPSLPVLAIGAQVTEVQSRLEAAGYRNVHDLEFEDGLWEATVTRADGSRGDIAIDPRRNEIFDARDGRQLLDAATVLERVLALGYRDVYSLERDGAIWDVEARDASGRRMELRLGGHDGRLLHSRPDRD